MRVPRLVPIPSAFLAVILTSPHLKSSPRYVQGFTTAFTRGKRETFRVTNASR